MSEAVTPQQPQSTEADLIAVRREKLAKLRPGTTVEIR